MASLLLDHNISPSLARLLRQAGHTAATALDMHLDTADDAELLRIAGRAGLIVATADDDFAILHRAGGIEHAGVLKIPEFRRGDARTAADAICSLLDSGRPAANELFAWSPESGWTRQA